jgi:hypothetical protein
MKWVSLLLFCCSLAVAADPTPENPRITYSKQFPGSAPPYIGITLDKQGAGEYKEAPDDDNPVKFQLTPSESVEIFSLAEKVDYFRKPLESPLKVAFMGTKTFRFEDGSAKTEVKFNYSEDPSARALADWFERISESEQHLINLERAAKYDRLGVLKALLLLETSLDRKRLVGTQQFLPMLDRIIKNESYMHTARARASGIAETIRAAK